MPLWRGELENVYAICARCNRRFPLADLTWQYGLLLCTWTDCLDSAVVGSRELEVVRQVAIDRKELQPDPKLYEVPDPKRDLDIVPYSGGES